MKNTQNIIQDHNVSRYSYISIQKPNGNHDVSQYFPDSTDKLVSEILKARVERLGKFKQEERFEKVYQNEEAVNIGNYHAKQISEIMPISKLASGFLNHIQLQKPGSIENQASSTCKQEQMKQEERIKDFEMKKRKLSVQNKQIMIVVEESHHSDKLQQKKSSFSSKIDYQQEKQVKAEQQQQRKSHFQASFSKHPDNHGHFTKSQIKFELPKVDILNNHSIDNHQKDAKIQASAVHSESVSDYLQFGLGKSVNPKSVLKYNEAYMHDEKVQNRQFYKNHQVMNADESKIDAKQSSNYVSERQRSEKKSFSGFGVEQKRDQTDRQVVQALNDRLNQINQIQQAEAISKRISSDRNLSSANFQTLITAQPQKKSTEKANFPSGFETQQSDDLRDLNILQHHHQSNHNLLQKQITELLMLYQGMILQEQCKQMRKKVKDAELENRKYKIKLRNASYSKRFNFHSPISKNNNKPLQFYKKFTVSQNLAAQYHQTIQRIAEEKKQHARLEQQYKVITNFEELMKCKQISSYQPLPFDLEYDNELGKYRTTKIGFFNQQSQKQAAEQANHSKKYEFSKTKRIVKLQEQEIKYYDLLNYKKDICKDTMLEFQVYNLGRIKQIKDQNRLICKEIEFASYKIQQVESLIQAEIDKIEGPKELPKSEYFIKSKKSFSRSPPVQSTRLFGAVSPKKLSKNSSQAKILSKKKISLTKSQEKGSLLKRKEINTKAQVVKASIIDQINDDYGLSNIQDANKEVKQIPTFGKTESQMLVMKINESRKRGLGSPLIRKVNYIKLNKDLLTRTEVNIQASKSRDNLRSEQVSPLKRVKKTFSINPNDNKQSNI